VTTSETPEDLAVQELERFRWLHLYADRVLIQQGAYVAAARQLQLRAVRSRWWGLALCAVWLAMSAVKFAVNAHAPHALSLVLGCAYLALGVSAAVQACLAVARTGELRRHIEALFPLQAQAADEAAAA